MMYEEFFGLKEVPFALSPDPSFLYLSKSHRMALTMLEYGLTSKAPISVVTGEVGCGKTTLLRRLLGQVPEDVTVGMVTQTHASFRDLLHWIALSFDIDIEKKTGIALYKTILEFLQAQHAQHRRVVLIIDEAQNLSVNALEGIRMLSNVNVEKDLILQLVLVGQPELLDKMRLPELRQLAQRVSVEYHLSPLTGEETARYIRHRIAVAGGDAELFTEEACDIVYRCSGGVPRLINTVCDMAMVYAFAEERRRIEKKLMAAVVRDRQNSSILPIKKLPDDLLDDDAAAPGQRPGHESAEPTDSEVRKLLDEDEAPESGLVIEYPKRMSE